MRGKVWQRLRLSIQQQRAVDAIHEWLRCGRSQVFHLDGAAGTGKTQLAVQLGSELPGVQFCAFTAKASAVLRSRGATNATTLHSLLYEPPLVKDNGVLVWTRRYDQPDVALIIADEVSTIGLYTAVTRARTGVIVMGAPV
jgi:exodeoxyribonuclease-5